VSRSDSVKPSGAQAVGHTFVEIGRSDDRKLVCDYLNERWDSALAVTHL